MARSTFDGMMLPAPFEGWSAQPEQQQMQKAGQEGSEHEESVLDGEEDEHDDDEDDENDDDDDEEAPDDGDEIVDRIIERLDGKIESMFDRRVNAVLKEVRGTPNGRRRDRQERGGQGRDREPVADVRGARSAFRDYVGDEVSFIGPEERRFATALGSALIAQRALNGFDDEDVVGAEVAAEVAKQVKSLRSFYETRTKTALRKRGLLAEKSGTSGTGGSKGSSPQQEFKKGAALAAARHGRAQQQ